MSILYEGAELIRCETCEKTDYDEGIDFADGTRFCKSCCEKSGMTGDPLKNIDIAEASRLANIDQLDAFQKGVEDGTRAKIKKDLMKIAEAGELEELRREVERYFSKI